MNKTVLIALLMSITLSSCTSNEDSQEVNIGVNVHDLMPDKLLKSIVGFDEDEPNPPHDYYQLFTYDSQGKLIKTYKDYGYIYPIYTNLSYMGNIVVVENKSNDGSLVVSKNIIYTLNSNGKVIEKYIPVSNAGNVYDVRKYFYEYNSDGKLSKITLKYTNITPGTPNYPSLGFLEKVDIFIYEGANLKKIVSQYLHNYNENNSIRTEITFLDYDNAKNPFKRLGLLDTYFYRSLSENNYREIKTEVYDENNVKWGENGGKWKFSYDQNNNMILKF
ncbi:hypothetical protein EGY05_05620 [Chryseobacterium arthrosphaerae]|uniref:hypothetical protein n=1 Tax=Chryseobacterium arthrosphaerae TaxID=651561 RepID=UPI000F5095BD|nr:hypothetical protein [Chryseobacterium arthrosphaerae]AYZ11435.1 hypothetical protein EGY05_05620 [Chryseobacterium arthrosphaerae]